MEFNVLIGGEAGQGMFSVEMELSELLSRLGYHFFATKNYMSRIRGGHNFHMIRVADRPVHALSGRPWDMIVAMDDGETERRHRPSLGEGGVFIGADRVGQIEEEAKGSFQDISASSTILVGLILAFIGADPAAAQEPRADEPARSALAKGRDFAARWELAGRRVVAPKAGDHCKLDGNQALALGALLGGCQFMAGYPMTPATSIMHYFATVAAEIPVHFEQAEDEIAALNMALGASYAGLRSMVATSGGGFALMTEAVSLAGMTETPIVIIDSQRPGPATGLPTRTEQGDLNFVLHAGHGEFPRVIFAPGSIEGAIALARKSFDLADRWQVPVFILTDQYLADSVQVMEGQCPHKNAPPGLPRFRGRIQALCDYGRRGIAPDLPRPFGGPHRGRLRRAYRGRENHGRSRLEGPDGRQATPEDGRNHGRKPSCPPASGIERPLRFSFRGVRTTSSSRRLSRPCRPKG